MRTAPSPSWRWAAFYALALALAPLSCGGDDDPGGQAGAGGLGGTTTTGGGGTGGSAGSAGMGGSAGAPAGSYFAHFPLEIIQPQPGLDLRNRFYKAYPGLEYNVRLAVIGGAYPYAFELTAGPTGMSMDARGEITWSDPVEAGSPHTVSARVTDVEGTSTDVTWSITVTTAGFRFIDANNGTPASSGATGAIDDPWRSLFDMYEGNDYDAKYRDSYQDEFIYWRAGTYTLDSYVEDCVNTCRVPLNGNKPRVWLAYPGEVPVLDFNSADNDAHIVIYGGVDHTYFDGLEVDVDGNSRGMGVVIAGNANHVTFRRNRMHGIVGGEVGGNHSLIFIAREDTAGQYFSLQDNVWSDVEGGYGVLGYSSSEVLVENNDARRITHHPIGPKEGTPKWTIRGNTMADNEFNSINLQYSNSHGIPSGDLEICFNTVVSGGGLVRINSNHTLEGLPVYVYRNTLVADVEAIALTANNGPFEFRNNIIVNDSTEPSHITPVDIDDASRLIMEDNLTGSAGDGIVDGDGLLQGSYRTDYLNEVGAEISWE